MKQRKFSIEKHGKGFVLYSGRDNEHHGYNLCSIDDFDMNGAMTLGLIRSAFVALEELAKLKKNIDDGYSHVSVDTILDIYEQVEIARKDIGDFK